MYYSSKNDTIFQIGKWERGTGLYVLKNATTQDSNESGKTPIWDDTGSSLETIFQNDSKDKVTLIVVTKEEKILFFVKGTLTTHVNFIHTFTF